jgi:hypothetical protein
VRRLLVLVALLGYPLFVGAWAGLGGDRIPVLAWGLMVGLLGAGVLGASWALYRFRRAMAQAPNAMLDERQVAVRDRAYLDAYRLFTSITLLVLVVAAIGADLADVSVELSFEVLQPIIWGTILYAIVLPSAVVAWREPDLAADD